MVKCVICDVSLIMPNHEVGAKAVDKIKYHYIQMHDIQEDRPAFIDYLEELLTPRETELVVIFCYCTDEVFVKARVHFNKFTVRYGKFTVLGMRRTDFLV